MLQVLQNVHVSPTRSSLITHSYVATKVEKGIQATLFIKAPKDPNFAAVQSNSVYLTTCNENHSFDDFFYSYQHAVVLTIPMYIRLLQFFRATWPKIKQHVENEFTKIGEHLPIQVDPHIECLSCIEKIE